MQGDEYRLRDDATAALRATNGDQQAACALLSQRVDADVELRQRFIAWGCASGWWKPTTWGAENGLWEQLIRATIIQAARRQTTGESVVPPAVR